MRVRHLAAILAALGGMAPVGAQLPSAPVHVRLLTPVASYSKPGAPVRARVIGSIDSPAQPPIAVGSILVGSVAGATSIGLGVKHERASLEIEFQSCELPGGEKLPCEAVVLGVDNARENVTRTGRIQGVLAASHPHSWLGGVWFRPGAAFSGRSASGLTGAGGKLQSILAPSAIGAALAVASRLVLFRFPDTEIELPAGADLIVALTVAGGGGEAGDETAKPQKEMGPAMREYLQATPVVVALPDGRPASDIVNLAFLANRTDLTAAFTAAGWSPADPLTPKTFARSYAAAAAMRTYSTAPVSPLTYDGRLPDAVFQKSLNSMAKRHHIRLWRVDSPEGELWLGAATHDVAASLDWSRISLTHRIDTNIDAERRKVIYDLESTGCAGLFPALLRPQLASEVDSGAAVTTDGALAIARLQNCSGRRPEGRPLKRPKRSFPAGIARRFVLEGRHYVTRGNAYYWAYRGVRWTFSPKRPASARRPVIHPSSPTEAGANGTMIKSVLNPGLAGTISAVAPRPTS